MMKFFLKATLLWFATTILFFSSQAQVQRDSLKGIINQYAQVSAFDICNAQLTVSDTTGFRKGTRFVMCQMNGADIQESNTSSFGNINNLHNVGKYEVNIVDSVAANTIFLKLYLKNEYNTGANIQIVTYPTYDVVVVVDTVRAKPWNGKLGGIIAFEANSLILNAPIIASGAGFRGGLVKSYSNCDALEFYTSYYYDMNTTAKLNGGPKGEGIATFIAGKECGRGPQGNGGGGGNNHKSGGGGGAHLAPGGAGGKQNHVSFIRNCIGDYPGGGGNPISLTALENIYFGGGGGAGHNREGSDNHGGAGGGIVILKANKITANNKTIAANGDDAPNYTAEGGSGGGAGGTVILLTNQILGSVNLEAKGGTGSNTISIQDYDFGPGGGGSGGRIMSAAASGFTSVLTGGAAGTNITTRQNQEAAKGSDGLSQSIANFTLPMSIDTVYRTLSIVQHPIQIQICEYQTTTFSVKARGTNLHYEWQINKGSGFVPIVPDTTFIGVGTPVLIVNRPRTTLNPYLFRCVVTGGCTQTTSTNSQAVGINILPAPVSLFTPIINYNTVQFNNTSSNGASFIWSFGDGRTSRSRDTTITYAAQGDYLVTLKTINNCDTNIYTVHLLLNAPPKASFSSTTTSYCTPANVQFTNTSSNNTLTYRWLFPGGSPTTSSDQNPSVLYTAAGVYDVLLIVANTNGKDTITRQSYIRANAAPIASFKKIQNGNNPTLNFDNQTIGATNFLWNFGDGTTSIEASPQHTYTTGGTFIIKLTASNNCGTTSSQDTIILLNRPSASISSNQVQGCSPFVVQFSGQNATNVSNWSWSFPGGTPSSSNLPNPRVVYNSVGSYSVALKVSNSAGIYETTQSDYVKVQLSPKADFDFETNDTLVKFLNKSLNATNYQWDFGDGTGSNLLAPPNKIYLRNGNYNVTLQALNSFCGAAITRQVSIFVVGTNDINNTSGKDVITYPNPTDGKLYLSFGKELTDNYMLVISNPNGSIMNTVKLSHEALQMLDLNALPNGIYFLQFSNEKQHFIKRIVKITN